MAEFRKIEYNFNRVDLQEMIDATGRQPVEQALGYLTSWNFSFPVVKINMSVDNAEFTALYYKDNVELGYVIGAIWRNDEGRFSFHS